MKSALHTVGILTLAPLFACAQPSITSVVNAASYDAVVSPGCWITIMGANLAVAPETAQYITLPTTLGGVSVTVGGVSAPLRYVSPSQINALIPLQVAIPSNTVVPLVIASTGGSATYNIRLTREAPAIFSQDGTGLGMALLFDGSFKPVTTVHPNDVLILYAAGLGPVDSSGNVVDPVEVYLGERKAQVLFAGLAPGMSGVYQLNVIAPSLATDRIYLRSGGWQSNITQVAINPGGNVSNVTGSVGSVYPAGNPAAGEATTFALMLQAGTFSAGMDIPSTAFPFDIAAVGEAGRVLISIDAMAACVNDSGVASTGAYTATVSTITSDGVRADFSGSIVPLWDYLSCDPATWACVGFPLSTIPQPRLGNQWTTAAQALPPPTTIATPGANAFLQGSGCLSDLMPNGGSHLAIDSQHNAQFSMFGGFEQLALGTSKTRVSTFSLYVDGNKIATKDVAYGVPYRQ